MKNIYLVLLLICSQITYSQTTVISIQGSLNSSNVSMTDNDVVSVKSAIGYDINLAISLKGSGDIGLSIEPGLSKKGYYRSDGGEYRNISITYIELPLLIDTYTDRSIVVSVGTSLSYMISAKDAYTGSYNNSSSYTNKMEISGVLRVFYTGINRIDLGLRIRYGFTPINIYTLTDQNAQNSYDITEYNKSIIGLVMRYNIIR